MAEGIDTEAAAEALRGLGCNEAQGYRFGPPFPAAEFPAWLCRFEAEAQLLATAC